MTDRQTLIKKLHERLDGGPGYPLTIGDPVQRLLAEAVLFLLENPDKPSEKRRFPL